MPEQLTFQPVMKKNSAAFEAVFEAPGGPKYCWCMAWRAMPDELKQPKGADRKRQMLGRIDDGVPVGLVGLLGDRPVAWVSVAPRETFRKLGGPDAEEGEQVWSLTCMFIARAHRGNGLGHQLISAAIAHARKHKADVLEAYPVDRDSPSYRHMGFVPAFEQAGFSKVQMAGTRRHVMRLTIS